MSLSRIWIVFFSNDAIATLDRACQDFERSMDGFTDGLEKMFDSFEGMLEVAFKK